MDARPGPGHEIIPAEPVACDSCSGLVRAHTSSGRNLPCRCVAGYHRPVPGGLVGYWQGSAEVGISPELDDTAGDAAFLRSTLLRLVVIAVTVAAVTALCLARVLG